MKRPSNHTGRFTFPLAASLLLAVLTLLPARAQDAPAKPASNNNLTTGQVTKGFTLPQYQNGKLNAMITGAEARVISVNRTEIIELKVDLYEADTISTTITSPKSDYWTADNKMRTRFGVVITRPDMTISAQTMEWEIKEQRGVLRQDVKVVLNTLDLSKPADSPSPQATAPLQSTTNLPGAIQLEDNTSLLLDNGTKTNSKP
jgi:hypothetical protein